MWQKLISSLMSVITFILSLFGLGGGPGGNADYTKATAQYKQTSSNPDLTSLDAYYKENTSGRPVVFFVHGGAYMIGDKSNANCYQDKAPYFTENGYVFISVNYRLSPAVKHPAHIEDLAAAFMYVYNHAEEWGGDKDNIFIMGHSAGAQLVALLATNNSYIEAAGGSLDLIRGVVCLDTNLYNSVADLETYRSAFDDEDLDDASCVKNVAAGKSIPPFLLFYRTNGDNDVQELFVQTLRTAGVPAAKLEAKGDSHMDINAEIGKNGDQKTEVIAAFLQNPADVENIVLPYGGKTE
ncbi:MAG: alpha/beta hydrolase [Oscillospiraceae bacterium]|jgi:dipeptidyl aminopeptidase/acylaminoacyl peptidase|nr:alpha/beta hydrolase [Oscillospiraceae bacterium]